MAPTPLETHQGLLQHYRLGFLGTQSLLVVAGALLLHRSPRALYAVAALSQVMAWALWFPVIQARHRLVDYHKLKARAASPEASARLCSERDYVHSRRLRTWSNRELGLGGNWRLTRLKLDAGLPVLYSLTWGMLVAAEACK